MRHPRVHFLLASVFWLLACGGEDDGASAWIGNTYLLEIPPQNWAKPRMIGDEIGDFVPQFLIGVEAASGGQADVTLSTAVEGVQDLCTPIMRIQASVSYPAIEIGPTDFVVHIAHINEPVEVIATIRGFRMTNVLPDGGFGELEAILDARDLYPLFTLLAEPDPDVVCDELSEYDAECEPCPQDGQPYCLGIMALRLRSGELFGGRIESATPDDPSCSDQGGIQ